MVQTCDTYAQSAHLCEHATWCGGMVAMIMASYDTVVSMHVSGASDSVI